MHSSQVLKDMYNGRTTRRAYEAALERAKTLGDAKPGTDEFKELGILASLIAIYEDTLI